MIKTGYYDYLTGLPNMSYFFELARESRKTFCESGKTAALLYMDLCGDARLLCANEDAFTLLRRGESDGQYVLSTYALTE